MAGIYLHIPFCKQACHYCDFHFSTDHQDRAEMVESMVSEIALQTDFLQEPVETIYFGGGTPSLLAPAELDKVLSAIHRQFNVVTHAEVTLEANPDDLVPESLLQLHQVGINRLSIGIQSFDNQFLQYLNRAHDAAAARRCLHDARDTGFRNISLDLIYAIPGLTNSQWMETMKEAIRFGPEHISTYSLTIEEKTVFGNWMRKGSLTPTDEETGAQQFELLMDQMEASGFEQYEISNFSRTGFYSRHNSSY